MLMRVLGPSWLRSSLPPRHRPPHQLLRWYSSWVRSLASRGQHPSWPHRDTRPLLVSWRLAGTLKSQLRREAKTLTRLTNIFSDRADRVQVITWIIFFSFSFSFFFLPFSALVIPSPGYFCGLCRFISLLPCQSDCSGTIGFIVYTYNYPSTTAVKTPSDLALRLLFVCSLVPYVSYNNPYTVNLYVVANRSLTLQHS